MEVLKSAGKAIFVFAGVLCGLDPRMNNDLQERGALCLDRK